jgi:hypothetical protein
MPPRSERQKLEDELADLQRNVSRFRSRHRYMCRNVSGEYSDQDILLAEFAIATAQSLADYTAVLIARCEVKAEADKMHQLRCRIADLCDLQYFTEEDERDQIEVLQTLEFKLLLWKQNPNWQKEDREAEQRVQSRKKPASRDYFWHVQWYQEAARKDIVMGEQQDFVNLFAAMQVSAR